MNVAFLGTGLMGQPLAERLLAAGNTLIVFNRTREKTVPLARRGARVAASPQEAIRDSELITVMVTDADVTRNLLFPEKKPADLAGRTVLQMSTIAPADSVAMLKAVQRAGGEYLEAPVLGSRPQAREGSLIVMVGARPQQFQRWREILRCFGPEPRLIGEVGKATALKLALNQIIASQVTGFSLSLGLVRRSGIEVDLFMELLRQSAFYAPTFDGKLPRMRERNFSEPNFPTRHFLKDVELMRNQAAALGLNRTVLDAIGRVIEKSLELGCADQDYSSVYEAIDPR